MCLKSSPEAKKEKEKVTFEELQKKIKYSEHYLDDGGTYKYRHVILPPQLAERLPREKLLSESEWRQVGLQQTPGWIHYAIHHPEPHIMLFRKPLSNEDVYPG